MQRILLLFKMWISLIGTSVVSVALRVMMKQIKTPSPNKKSMMVQV